MNDARRAISPGRLAAWGLTMLGAAAVVYRFYRGLGAVTNLNDGYPWGLWVTVDILGGVALASGGFVIAGAVHLFGGRRYQGLARPAILTALLGYIMFGMGLVVDLGRPWNLPNLMLFGNHESPLYEIGWCAFLYTLVLCLELLPAVFERYSWRWATQVWRRVSPWIVILMVGVFAMAMTHSVAWTIAIACLMLGWEGLMAAGIMPRDKQTPILLIMAGVIFSFLHQSSLGTLYLMLATKLNPLWYTPLLPILFLLSAIMAGMSVVTLEALASRRFLGHAIDLDPYRDLMGKMPLLLGLYIVLKFEDLASRNAAAGLFSLSVPALAWWLEMLVGAILPLALFLRRDLVRRPAWLAFAAGMVVLGLMINRTNVSLVGISVPRWDPYYPRWSEWLITIGIFSAGLLAYDWLVDNLPILPGSGVELSRRRASV